MSAAVSACIPCFNRSGSLPRVIRALQQQTLRCVEIVLIDDGSSDDSARIAASLGARVLRNEINLGRGAVRSRAINETCSEYIFFCDAGLAPVPVFLERALPHLSTPRVAAVFGRVVPESTNGPVDRWETRHLFRSFRTVEVEHHKVLNTGAAVLRRDTAVRAGNFNPALREGEDWELGTRLLRLGLDVVFDPALEASSMDSDSLVRALERYARWNTTPSVALRFRDYARLLAYSAKVMAREDLRSGDPLSAMISLMAPHYQFWRARKKSIR